MHSYPLVSLFLRKYQGFSEVMSDFSYVYRFRSYAKLETYTPCLTSATEKDRRQTFRDEIVGQLPFDLIGMDDTLPSVEIPVSRAEGTKNSHYDTLERTI